MSDNKPYSCWLLNCYVPSITGWKVLNSIYNVCVYNDRAKTNLIGYLGIPFDKHLYRLDICEAILDFLTSELSQETLKFGIFVLCASYATFCEVICKFPLHPELSVTSGRCFKGQGYFPTNTIFWIATFASLKLCKQGEERGISLLKSKVVAQSGISRKYQGKLYTFCGISSWAHNNAENTTLSIAIFVHRPLFLDA